MTGRHRSPGLPVTRLHDVTFVPRHCAGHPASSPWSCLHAHPGEPPVRTFPLLRGGHA